MTTSRSRPGRSPRRIRFLGRAALVAGLAVVVSACGGGGGPTPAPASAPPGRGAACLAQPSGGPYLRSSGGRLVCGETTVALTGYTFYPALAGGTKAWHASGFASYIDHVLDMGVAAGQNLVRATDQWDKTTLGQDPEDPVVWANMDHLLEGARRRGMFVVLDLSAYRWLLMSRGLDPWNAEAWTSFLNFVGARYHNSDAVAFYSISGEPAPPVNADQESRLLDFYRTTSTVLRAADPNHLITVGGFNHMEEERAGIDWWQAIDALPANDLVAVKTYSQHDVDLMPAIASYAASVGKPVVDEEFGMPQGYGDASPAGPTAYNGLAAGRAAFFQTVYERGRSLGFAGFVFWNMGCQVGASSYEVSPQTPATWQVVRRFGATAAPAGAPMDDGALCA